MLFRKKGKLKKEYDDRLVHLMQQARGEWQQQKNLSDLSFEKSPQMLAEEKMAEARYFYLFKEARHRKIVIK
ncbi:YaaL family protein [Jeotgalibacillus haloalkalitolerans]|uniref:YaaL family protein n=1 Tax=Jeotgalibacillus haloalkalitolerans TaxID=3104292 RepID=A0ABU5KRG7_9BACL|nr:YaaL family protein [Jeotgalibacillus sp. HH7-29]MDZ5713838.1 YaaL family protein [Jeotgalibacillus sp. HH7-29]